MGSQKINKSKSTELKERRRAIEKIINDEPDIGNQEVLVRKLARMGFKCSQATVSRDLKALGYIKPKGADRYIQDQDSELQQKKKRLARAVRETVQAVHPSPVPLAIRTAAGHAGSVAVRIEEVFADEVFGTIAGGGVAIIIANDAGARERIARAIEEMRSDL